jgi:hypothetical protein
MKKLLLVAFAVVSAFAAQAQASFGIRAGANLSNLSGDLRDEDRFENKIGFHGGVTANFGVVEDFFSIQPELLYSVKGFKNEDSDFTILGQTYRREGKVHYNYLELPVLAKIKAGPLYFEAGPQASYLLSVKNETETFINGDQQSRNVSEKSKEGLSEFEVGYVAGIGLTSANNAFSVGVRYNGSFSDFVDEDVNFEGDLTNARHSVFMVTVGIAIPTSR